MASAQVLGLRILFWIAQRLLRGSLTLEEERQLSMMKVHLGIMPNDELSVTWPKEESTK